jgi:MYXO-CTERM domain-containing protein
MYASTTPTEGTMHGNRLLTTFVFGVVCLVFAPEAWALPPPMTETELMDAAELVVDAICVDIVCDGPSVADTEKVTTTYVSTLFPTFSYKGGLPNSIQIRGFDYDYFGPEPVGGWHQGPVPEGWAGKLYLVQLPDNTYTKVWWNAMEEDPAASNPVPLPSCEAPDPDAGVEADAGLDGGIPTDAAAPDAALLPDGATPDSGGGDPSSPSGGCQCDTPASSPPAGFLLWLLVGLCWLVVRRPR